MLDTRRVCVRAIQKTANKEEYLKQLIMESGFKTADFV